MWNADFPTKFSEVLLIYFRTKSSNILLFFIFSNEFASFPIFSNSKVSSVQCHGLAEFTARVSQQEGISCYNRGSTIKRFWRANLDPGLQKLLQFCFINIPYDEIGGARSPKSSIDLVKQTHKGHFDCRADVSSERTYRTACRRKAGGLWPGLRTGVSYTSYY